MVNAVVRVKETEKPSTFGWLQLEKKAAQELQALIQKSPVAACTLMYMVNNMSRSNALVVSQQVIADGINAKRQTVNQAIRYLVEHNFIQVVKAGGVGVYVVNSRVMWQGNRGARYAAFGADIIAVESEQPAGSIDKKEPLKCVPHMVGDERLLVSNNPIDPPDQQELDLP